MELKKNPQADLEKKKPAFIQIGLVLSLAFTLIAFEWKSYQLDLRGFRPLSIDLTEDDVIPITRETPPLPPPPPVVVVDVKIVDDDKIIEEELIISSEADENTKIEFVPQEEETIPEIEKIYYLEDMPEFPGGEAELFKYLKTTINYPKIAKENGIQGVVYVTFIVKADGSISDIEVLRGIKGGCDEEAIRVVKSMPKWKPGLQRGRPVDVHFNLPIRFVLK
jgi:periplasmic protein TonB